MIKASVRVLIFRQMSIRKLHKTFFSLYFPEYEMQKLKFELFLKLICCLIIHFIKLIYILNLIFILYVL